VSAAEKFLIWLTAKMTPMAKLAAARLVRDVRRFFSRKTARRYPGEGDRLARRTAKAKRKGGIS
jgi:hypothetical protein